MAVPSSHLVRALRRTALTLRSGSPYRWTHQGACNCGHLVQTLTRRTPAEIHRAAITRAGDWGQHAIDYCPTSGLPVDEMLGELLEAGLALSDVGHLERLSDPRVLRTLPAGERHLDFRRRDDVVRYLEAWAGLLEAEAEARSDQQTRWDEQAPRAASPRRAA
ncbi:MAG: hypothetical protein ACFCGT_13460 [Sandaracinaceae bacterium]